MTNALHSPRLALVVDNPQALQQGSAPRHSFDKAGGTIGSRGADWILHDRRERVRPVHCEIRHEDGHFFVIDRCGQTYVNQQQEPLGDRVSVRLSVADTLHIGPYRITVYQDDEPYVLPDASRHLSQHDVGELLGAQTLHLDGLPQEMPDTMSPDQPVDASWVDFQALSEPPPSHGQMDPLQALDEAERLRSSRTIEAALAPRHYGHAPLAAQVDLATTRFEAVSGNPLLASGDPRMSDHDTTPSAADRWLRDQYNNGGNPAGLVTPLLEGLGAPVGALDPLAVHGLLFESGKALGALIRGLSALHDVEQGQPRRLALGGRTLQPIEDNPLRLRQSYDDTVRALFAQERSVVHLAPSAAVEESLDQIRQQQIAMMRATAAGLGALLQAFAPDQLERRFTRYRSGQDAPAQAGEWTWQMYRHYYDELISSRQQGFDKLFWEVFDQAYDQALRAEAQ